MDFGRPLDDDPRVYRRAVKGAVEQLLEPEHAVPVVEEHDAEDLVSAAAEQRRAVVECRGGRCAIGSWRVV